MSVVVTTSGGVLINRFFCVVGVVRHKFGWPVWLAGAVGQCGYPERLVGVVSRIG